MSSGANFLADGAEAEYNKAMLWDLTVNRTLYDTEDLGISLFATVRNIFDGNQYVTERWPNAPVIARRG